MQPPFDFVPFDRREPQGATRFQLGVTNPRYAEEVAEDERRSAADPRYIPNAQATLAPTFSTRPEDLVGADETCVPHPRVALVVGYPFRGKYTVAVNASSRAGFTRAELLRHILSIHEAMFEDVTLGPGPLPGMTGVDSPRFGKASHTLDELEIELIEVETLESGNVLVWIWLAS